MHNNIKIILLKIFLLLFIFSLYAKTDAAHEEKQITVIFRFDDYSSHSSTEIEVKLIDTFKKYNAPFTIGVIPYVSVGNGHDVRAQDVVPLTKVKANILKKAVKASVLEVAQHGYSHQTINEKAYTEFSGLDYNSQVSRIAKGKNYLEEMLDTRIVTFIPPWNTYDLNTIRALENLGFKSISAAELGDAKMASPIKYLPSTCGPLHLRDAVESARRISDIQPIIIVLLHQYDFFEVDREKGKLRYEDFEELLAWITSQKDIHVRSIDQASEAFDDLGANHFKNYNSYLRLSFFIPQQFLSKLYTAKVYLSTNTINNMKIKLWVFVLFFYLAIMIISFTLVFIFGLIVFPRSRFLASICKYGSPALLVLLSVYALRNLNLQYKGLIAIVIFLGVCIGVWSSFLKLKKQRLLI